MLVAEAEDEFTVAGGLEGHAAVVKESGFGDGGVSAGGEFEGDGRGEPIVRGDFDGGGFFVGVFVMPAEVVMPNGCGGGKDEGGGFVGDAGFIGRRNYLAESGAVVEDADFESPGSGWMEEGKGGAVVVVGGAGVNAAIGIGFGEIGFDGGGEAGAGDEVGGVESEGKFTGFENGDGFMGERPGQAIAGGGEGELEVTVGTGEGEVSGVGEGKHKWDEGGKKEEVDFWHEWSVGRTKYRLKRETPGRYD